jgi:hypothetical protein
VGATPVHETAAGRRALAKKGLALPDGGFPVPNADYWDKARQSVGRVKNPARRAALAGLLRKTAPKFGKTQALQQSWAAPAGSAHANPDLGIYLAETAKDEQGQTLTCPECGHVAPAGDFGASGTSLQTQPEDLRTPAPSTAAVRDGVPLTVKSGAAHALAGGSARQALELAAGTLTARRHPIQGPTDVMVARGEDGTAVLRHRHGGT